MALTKCKECGKEISTKAKTCPHCGASSKTSSGCAAIVLAIACLFLISYVWSALNASSPPSPQKQQNIQGVNSTVQYLISEGVVKKIDLPLNRAYVNMRFWNSFDVEMKEQTARTLAYHCGYKKKNDSFWVDIYDWRSGKKLAEYSKPWGFKTY